MRTSVRLCSAAAVSAASLAMLAAPAFADSANNNGINVLNGNNVSVLPLSVCNGGQVTVLGIVAHALSDNNLQSPHGTKCVNAPIVDHPTVGN